MQNNDTRSTPIPATTLSASQVADRMGLTTQQLQDLRLRGIGPPIVQRGLSIHYLPADVQDIERHEAAMLIEQVLASDRPLTLLRAMADHAGFKLSPILQQVSVSTSPPIPQPPSEPPPEPSPEPPPATPPVLTVICSDDAAPLSTESSAPSTLSWYLVHTKPRQEEIALANLQRQGYECYLPQMRIERVRRRKAEVATEPMFPRYLFIRLDSSDQGQSWSPIRSTLGVSRLVTFGQHPARVPDALVEALRQAPPVQVARLFAPGDVVQVVSGPLQGAQGVVQASDGEQRALVLIELLGQPQRLQLMLDDLSRSPD